MSRLEGQRKRCETNAAPLTAEEEAEERSIPFSSLNLVVDGVECATREQYLTPADVPTYYGVVKEYLDPPKPWKENNLKKNVGLR